MKKTALWVLCVMTVFFAVSCGGDGEQTLQETNDPPVYVADILLDDLYSFAAEQLRKSVADVGANNEFPFYTEEDGTWSTRDSAWWSSGFFAGSLWMMYDQTGDEFFLDAAEKWTQGMFQEKDNGSDADIGYKIINSCLLGYKITGEEKYKIAVLDAAEALAGRYNEAVGAVKGYDGDTWQFPLVIDHMLNIELLWWGAANGGDPAWRDMAISHSNVTMKKTIRPDGSSIQLVDLDPETGELIKNDTLCGLSGESAWARGQGEGIYGFAIAYRETGDPAYLEAFTTLADYFLDNLPEDMVPYWDFKDPDIPNVIRDASAASMMADGLLEMVPLMEDGPERTTYYNAAVQILESLAANYLTTGTPSLGIIDHASFQGKDQVGADTALVFGDFDFISALRKYEALKDTM